MMTRHRHTTLDGATLTPCTCLLPGKEYPSAIKADAAQALADPPGLPDDHRITAMLANPDRIRAARELMEQTWERSAPALRVLTPQPCVS